MTPKIGFVTDEDWTTDVPTYGEVAVPLALKGYAPIPVAPGTKKTGTRDWSRRSVSSLPLQKLEEEARRHRDHSVAIVNGPVCWLDVDEDDPVRAAEVQEIIGRFVGGEPPERVGNPPRFALLYRAEGHIRTRRYPGFEVLGAGSYVMVFGIHPKTGAPYRWRGGTPLTRPVASLPPITQSAIDELIKRLSLVTPVASRTGEGGQAARSAPGRIADGRDQLLTSICYEVWCGSRTECADELADAAWAAFRDRADLGAPKRNGRTSWSHADAVRKVRYLLKRAVEGKVKRPAGLSGELTYLSEHEPFVQAVNALAARRLLSPAAVRLSLLMLCLCRNGGGCFASVQTLAEQLDLAEGSVKRLRRRLVAQGLWARRVHGQGRGKRSEYMPCPERAISAAEKVTRLGAWITSKGEGESGGGENQDTGSDCLIDFISLGRWAEEAGA